MNFENNNINENKKLEYINDKAKMWLSQFCFYEIRSI